MDVDGEEVVANVDEGVDEYDYIDGHNFLAGIVRVPPVLLHTIAAKLYAQYQRDRTAEMGLLSPRYWMRAIAVKFPNTRLAILRSTNPCLLPSWILHRVGFKAIQVQPIDCSVHTRFMCVLALCV